MTKGAYLADSSSTPRILDASSSSSEVQASCHVDERLHPSSVYSFLIVLWLPRNNLERFQYMVGFVLHLFTSPFMNIIVLVYSLIKSDDISWGKTREVVAGGDDDRDGDALGGRGTH
ncbi:chitin synthase domain-containing protein [Hirsutella rhossiliensis]|uniref:Chitin synthase domain-containing protein n=1 Tax=Hirsutella rhossiliensis TaxID=111463 RepID=A0A9P8SKP3_9HYPO|nr:chitin synthase domain-containing protein [Hirsutella rhossiliensis]KAH0966091.1 chitin synthase domain-containing protein [Hirsutella rhossiliensis]